MYSWYGNNIFYCPKVREFDFDEMTETKIVLNLLRTSMTHHKCPNPIKVTRSIKHYSYQLTSVENWLHIKLFHFKSAIFNSNSRVVHLAKLCFLVNFWHITREEGPKNYFQFFPNEFIDTPCCFLKVRIEW